MYKVFKIQKRAEQQLHLTKTQADQEHLHTKPKQQQSLENYHIDQEHLYTKPKQQQRFGKTITLATTNTPKTAILHTSGVHHQKTRLGKKNYNKNYMCMERKTVSHKC
ncbi:hypothetical protein CVS40_11719 [Lucilia cuprina]|nr:hypothetical protein CVS40_11719 [Lucilia cuprina]